MPDDLYDRDVLAWSERQADLLRRLARGERVNDVDWEHVVEEIEDVGLSELHAVESFLDLILVHLLKLAIWPADEAANPWSAEIVAFQRNATRRYAPSMRQRIDLRALYQAAIEQVTLLNRGELPMRYPDACPWTLDHLLRGELAELRAVLAQAGA